MEWRNNPRSPLKNRGRYFILLPGRIFIFGQQIKWFTPFTPSWRELSNTIPLRKFRGVRNSRLNFQWGMEINRKTFGSKNSNSSFLFEEFRWVILPHCLIIDDLYFQKEHSSRFPCLLEELKGILIHSFCIF